MKVMFIDELPEKGKITADIIHFAEVDDAEQEKLEALAREYYLEYESGQSYYFYQHVMGGKEERSYTFSLQEAIFCQGKVAAYCYKEREETIIIDVRDLCCPVVESWMVDDPTRCEGRRFETAKKLMRYQAL